jgi:hypothetical protein
MSSTISFSELADRSGTGRWTLMYVEVDISEGGVAIDLREPYDFTSLGVRGPVGWAAGDVLDLLSREADGRPDGPSAVWLPTDRLRRWASRRVGDTWESGFAAMLETARQRTLSSADGSEVLAVLEPDCS